MSIGHTNRMPTALKRAASVSAAALIASLVLAPIPGAADPDSAEDDTQSGSDKLTLSEAREKVDTLNHQAEIAAEAMNTVKVKLKAAREHLTTLDADVERQRERVDALRDQVIGRAMSSYQNGGGLSTSTSAASTGSVGARTAPSSTAAPSDNPSSGIAIPAIIATVSAMETVASRTGSHHRLSRQSTRSFSPAVKSDTITPTSAR